jgi:hypothetical protein
VIGPKIVAFADRSGVVQPGARRSGDTIDALIEPYSDSTAGRIGFAQSFYDTGTLTLRRDGHQIGEASGVNAGTWAVPAQGGLYTMTLEADRPAPNWYLSTSLRTTWTFHSGHVDAGTSALPVLLVGYDIPLDASRCANEQAAPAQPAARSPRYHRWHRVLASLKLRGAYDILDFDVLEEQERAGR